MASNFHDAAYDRYRSSPEVLQAIETRAGEPLPLRGKAGEAYRIWSHPILGEREEIEADAQELAHEGETLTWNGRDFHDTRTWKPEIRMPRDDE